MATGTTQTGGASGAGRNSRADLLQTIGTLNSMFGGGATKTTQTSGRQVSPEALNSIIRQMQSQAGGMASVMLPQRTAGLYGSNVNQLLTQQYAENIAGKAAELSTPTRTTQMAQPQTSPLAKGLGALGAAAQVYSLLGKPGMAKAGTAAAGALGGGALAQIYKGNLDSSIGDLTKMPTDWIANVPGSEAADFLTAEGFGDIGISLSQLASPAASFGQSFTGASDAFSSLGLGDILGAVGGGGSDLLGSIGSGIGDAASSVWDTIASWF